MIQHTSKAGKIENGYQYMYNDIRVTLGSYGTEDSFAGVHELLYQNKGVHEPEEELEFSRILRSIENGGVMIELGLTGRITLCFCKLRLTPLLKR